MSVSRGVPHLDPRKREASARLTYGRLSPLRYPIQLLTVVLLALLLAGLAGGSHWRLELITQFPLQLGLGLGFCALVLAAFGAWRWVLFAALGGLFATAQWWPRYSESADSPIAGVAADLRVLLANVQVSNRSFEAVAGAIRDSRADLVVIEEVDEAWIAALQPALAEYPVQLLEPRADPFGLVVAARDSRAAARRLSEVELKGPPAALLQLPVRDRWVRVIVLHAVPPIRREVAAQRNAQLASAAHLLADEEGPKLLVGDLNASPWSPHFRRLLREAGLVDPRRGGFGRQATWPATFPDVFRVPVDHILSGGGLEVVGLRTGRVIGSDHLPLTADLRLREE